MLAETLLKGHLHNLINAFKEIKSKKDKSTLNTHKQYYKLQIDYLEHQIKMHKDAIETIKELVEY